VKNNPIPNPNFDPLPNFNIIFILRLSNGTEGNVPWEYPVPWQCPVPW